MEESLDQTFGAIGPRLERLGHDVVPVPPGQKGPRLRGWPTPRPVAERLPEHAGDGVAILDIDVLEESLATEIRDAAWTTFGVTSERIGQALTVAGVHPGTGRSYRWIGPALWEVASAPEGHRNEVLNREAFGLGRFVAEDRLSPIEVTTQLVAAPRLEAAFVDWCPAVSFWSACWLAERDLPFQLAILARDAT